MGLMRVLVCILVLLTTSSIGRAAPVVPLNSVFCAALLIAPEFERLGRARPVDQAVRRSADPSLGELASLIVEVAALDGKTPRQLTFNREFRGERDIRAYVEGVFALSDELQAVVDATEPKFWTRERLKLALKTAGIPALSVAVVAGVALEAYVTQRWSVEVGAMGLLASAAMVHLQRADYLQTGRYLRALVQPRARSAARNHEGSRAVDARQFLSDLGLGNQSRNTAVLLAHASPALSDLLMDPPKFHDIPAVTENHRALLHDQMRELPRFERDERSHSFWIDFETYVDADSVPHLIVSVTMTHLESERRPPRRPRRRTFNPTRVTPGGLLPVGLRAPL